MKSSVETLEPTKVKLTVEVPFEEFKPAIDNAAKDIGKQVNIPGFRRGHIPARVIEARFGRGAIVEEALNGNLDGYYAQAVSANELHPMSRPAVEVTQVPAEKDDTSDLVFVVTVDVRPEIAIPDPSTISVTVDRFDVSDEDVDARLTALRERFGSLKEVERAAQDGDYATIDLTARIDGEEVDAVSGISYRIGSGTMLEGLDDALTGRKAGETVTFSTTLAGGDHAGEAADVTVTVGNVKESELPEADDDFAQLASEFDTVDELRADLRGQLAKDKASAQVYAARDLLLQELREAVDFPLPETAVEEEVARHLEQEGKEADDPHAAEAREETERLMRDQLLLDVLSERFNVNVEQNELFNFLVEQAKAYGMEPNQFIQAAAQANQFGAFAAELARGKALLSYLRLVETVDSDGNPVDVAEVIGKAPEGETVPDFSAHGDPGLGLETSTWTSPVGGEAGPFDPASAKVDDVLAYVANVSEEEKARVIDAEKKGKNRKTLLEKLEG